MAIDGFDPGRIGGGCADCEINNTCESYKMWRQHYCWNHTSGYKQFIIRASGDFKHSLNMPLSLVDHFKEDISTATIQLEDSGHNVYDVEASKHSDDQIVLQCGWHYFAVSHRIRENHLLIFRSKGRTPLQVLILDPSRKCRTLSPHTVSSSDDDHIVGEETRGSLSCAKSEKVASTSSPSAKSEYEAHRLNGRASVELGVDSEPLSSNNLEGPSPSLILTEGITLTELLKKKVEEKVQAIRSELPIFVAVMNKSNISIQYPSLRFCAEYARHLPARKKALVLQTEGSGKEWCTTLSINDRNSRLIHRGWSEFVAGNHLQEGDISLFELAKSTNGGLRMVVYFVCKSDIEE